MNQFTPVDTPVAIDTFLGYWKPNAVVLMESELWPNLVMSAARNGVSYTFMKFIYGMVRHNIFVM